MPEDIIKEILNKLPAEKISDACFEGSNIVLYTKDKDFFLNNNGIIKDIVNEIKKRIELRPDPSITMEVEKAKELIKQEKIRIAVVAVPASVAQKVVDVLVDAGIKAILNFAPVSIFVPRGVTVRNENMAIEMEALSYALTNRRR